MKYIGAHVSISGGIENAPLNAHSIGANAFALFTKNQRQWNAPPFNEESLKKFKDNLKEVGIDPWQVLPHDSYLINLGNADKEKREKSFNSFLDEVKRVEQLGLHLLNFHPGSHLNEISIEESMDLIAQGMNRAIEKSEHAILVIENTAGQGSNIGFDFDHLAYIIDKIKNKERVGVCLDTCHLFAAGYDISGKEGVNKVIKEFDKKVGLKYLRGMHLNDCKFELGQKKDRHESLGKGKIGIDAFITIAQDERFNDIPLILETPDPSIWEEEITLLRKKAQLAHRKGK